ncbi:MAG: hypothetical protein PWQ83_1375 [Thermosipho sp. (in: thermotogales)]|nr:hypothetical protein [Thermosipho sp. (in: thermotogales)]
MSKRFIFAIIFILLVNLIYADITSVADVQLLAREHAKEDVNKFFPFLGGLILGPFSPLFQYFSNPEVPALRLVDVRSKISSENDYLFDLYVKTYKNEVKKIKANMGWLGFGSMVLIILLSSN